GLDPSPERLRSEAELSVRPRRIGDRQRPTEALVGLLVAVRAAQLDAFGDERIGRRIGAEPSRGSDEREQEERATRRSAHGWSPRRGAARGSVKDDAASASASARA